MNATLVSLATPVVLVLAGLFALNVLTAVVLLKKGNPRSEARFKAQWVLGAVLWLTIMGIHFWQTSTITSNYTGMLASAHARVDFPGHQQPAKGPVAQAFLSAVLGGQDVSAHHSHPVERLRFGVPEAKPVFTLCTDSQHPDEYWLEVDDPAMNFHRTEVRHFQSDAVTRWLHAHERDLDKP